VPTFSSAPLPSNFTPREKSAGGARAVEERLLLVAQRLPPALSFERHDVAAGLVDLLRLFADEVAILPRRSGLPVEALSSVASGLTRPRSPAREVRRRADDRGLEDVRAAGPSVDGALGVGLFAGTMPLNAACPTAAGRARRWR
jgi:hypothetical protein